MFTNLCLLRFDSDTVIRHLNSYNGTRISLLWLFYTLILLKDVLSLNTVRYEWSSPADIVSSVTVVCRLSR